MSFDTLGLALLFRFSPETAHGLSIAALKAGLGGRFDAGFDPRLASTVCGLAFPNPLGMAAGYDKNAEVPDALLRLGFGFAEVGTVTPRPQPGNPKPRIFRLPDDRGVINRLGFNNEGHAACLARLKARASRGGIVGVNIGANKDSDDRAGDYVEGVRTFAPLASYLTVNVSSPNTERLRDLQGRAALGALLRGVMAARDRLARPVPVFLKIAPDLSDPELEDIADTAREARVDAIAATNTTLERAGLHGPHADEKGGLSGAPLFGKSTRVLARLSALTNGDIPLIGIGGIGSPEDAYAKICAGACAVQLYTALVYNGLSLAADIANGLDRLLARDGFASVAEAIGSRRKDWL